MPYGEKKCCCNSKKTLEQKSVEHSCCCGKKKVANSFLSEGVELTISAISLIASFLFGIFDFHLPFSPWSDPAIVAIYFCALPLFKEARDALERGKIVIPMLVSLAILSALLLQVFTEFGWNIEKCHGQSYIFVAGEIAFLMALGEWLEARTVKKARGGIEALTKIIPKTALIKRDGKELTVEASEILVGDILCVRPHEMIAADGVIIQGSTGINEANMTGESLPVDKTVGDKVLAGTFNESAYIEVRVEKTVTNSSLAKLIKLIEEAEGKKAPISRFADKCATFVVPMAIVSSVVVFFTAHFALGTTWSDSLIRAVTILVVFCPCAFVLATPTAISAGLGNAAKNGILIKSGASLEKLSRIDSIYFDKTGTLTNGLLNVCEIRVRNISENELLYFASSAEKYSQHPLAKALVLEAQKRSIELSNCDQLKSFAGFGVEALVDGKKVFVGKVEGKVDDPFLAEEYSKGRSVVEVMIDNEHSAFVSFEDFPRDSAKSTIGLLSRYKCAMLSGDNYKVACSIAESVGIKTVYAPLLPEQKLQKIIEAKELGNKVCMVGDGVNDAPALTTADISIAIAQLNNDIAMSVSEISLMGGDLRKIASLFNLSNSVMNTVKCNMAFSVLINITTVFLSLFGIITPVLGAVIHTFSSVGVVLNSARLLNKKF